MDSAGYLLDNDAVPRHLACVAAHLEPGGLYVLEMSHSRDTFAFGASTSTSWAAEADGLRVEMQWGDAGDAFDPIGQVDDVTVTMSWAHAGGEFELIEWLGALAPPLPFDNERAAWRMVPVLRKRALRGTADQACQTP